MKNKFSDDTLNRDGLPKHNQESAEKGKIKLLDVVALTQDVPEHNLKRGEVGTIVEILSNGEDIRTSGEYDVYRGEDRMYECVSSSMFRMTRPLAKLIERVPQLVSEIHTVPLLSNTDDSQEEFAVRIHTANIDELEEYGMLPVHRRQLLENPDLLMEASQKEFDREFQSRSNRIYESAESDIQSEIQHHLGKTRYIDMSKCPYIALFFACYGGGNHGGRIMFFKRDEIKISW